MATVADPRSAPFGDEIGDRTVTCNFDQYAPRSGAAQAREPLRRVGRVGGSEQHDVRLILQPIEQEVGVVRDQHRIALCRPGGIERAHDPQIGATIIDPSDLAAIEISCRRLVDDQCVLVPAVPQRLGCGHAFHRPVQSLGRRQHRQIAEKRSLRLMLPGLRRPSHAAAAQNIHGGEAACDVERLRIGRADDGDKADALGRRDQPTGGDHSVARLLKHQEIEPAAIGHDGDPFQWRRVWYDAAGHRQRR